MTPIEAMARAMRGIQPHMQAMKSINHQHWVEEVELGWRDCAEAACAALDALADNVSEGMCREGYLEWECATDEGYFYSEEDDMKLIFRSMLKAAREEG